MIGKLKKGSSFGGCIRYVTGKDEAKIIASDGVLLGIVPMLRNRCGVLSSCSNKRNPWWCR